ncbi:MAG: hypothetical protein KAG91_00810 [Mycoplasmataceae bacterium]|nr:hypothetical protein [Mycoplasmataceae bacterium]
MVKYERIKGLTQEAVARKVAQRATDLMNGGHNIISITQYADSASIGRNKAATIYYTEG